MKIVDILNITLEDAYKNYIENNLIFIIKDGKLKGFSLERMV